ncbi:MAG: hypothetical protein WCD89_08650 [Anaerocolumna sp.]
MQEKFVTEVTVRQRQSLSCAFYYNDSQYMGALTETNRRNCIKILVKAGKGSFYEYSIFSGG